MKKYSKKLINRFKRFWVWSRINRIPDKLTGEDQSETTDETTKQLISIFKNLLKESHAQLYKVNIDYDTYYEIHDNVNKIYITLLHKTNCSELHLMKFPIKSRSLSEYKIIINKHIADRLIQSMQYEIQNRILNLHHEFETRKNENLEEISKHIRE